MKLRLLFILMFFSTLSFSQVDFNQYFAVGSMRVDFTLAGDANAQSFYLEQLKKEPFWGGTKTNMVNSFDYGGYIFEVYDSLTNKLIYSNGFSTLFNEWQTTAEAENIKRSFYQTITFPFPKKAVQLKVFHREKSEKVLLFEYFITPDNYFINPELELECKTKKMIDAGETDKKVDLAFIAEGYTREEMGKFKDDVKKMVDYMMEQPPFDKHRDDFNIWLIFSESKESGTDIPGKYIYKNTVLNSSFYTFDSERYLTTQDIKSIRDAAANVPYDHICILVNHEKYGGGGIYNYYTLTTVDHSYSKIVFVHEFGHGFGGLGDEYYNSSVSYDGFYDLSVEPWEPNITTLVDFESKWKDMIKEDTPVPTPREEKYENTVGVYEGGGYVAKGVYSPYIDCRMNTNNAPGFCPVCQRALERMIRYYTE